MTNAPPHEDNNAVLEPSRRIPGAWLWVSIALVLAPLSPLTWYAGGIFAIALLVAAGLMYRRGFHVRGVVIGATIALVVSLVVTMVWERYVNTSTEVEGAEQVEQQRVINAFDQAFANAEKEPARQVDAGSKKADAPTRATPGEDND